MVMFLATAAANKTVSQLFQPDRSVCLHQCVLMCVRDHIV